MTSCLLYVHKQYEIHPNTLYICRYEMEYKELVILYNYSPVELDLEIQDEFDRI